MKIINIEKKIKNVAFVQKKLDEGFDVCLSLGVEYDNARGEYSRSEWNRELICCPEYVHVFRKDGVLYGFGLSETSRDAHLLEVSLEELVALHDYVVDITTYKRS